MLDDEDGAGETAISYTDQFLDAAVAKIDALFGAGYAKTNPALVSAYISTCSANLSGFMQSAMTVASMSGADLFADALDELDARPPQKRKRR
jgi:phage gp29-like protein